MSGYDIHMCIKELTKMYGKINPIANKDEKNINYKVNCGYGFEFHKNETR